MASSLVPPPPARFGLIEAKAYVRRLARHYENFTVVSWFLPREKREDFLAVYAFCRWSDDLGDTDLGGKGPDERLAALDAWEGELEACYAGTYRHPILLALSEPIRKYGIPIDPLRHLLQAFRMDQRVVRYATFQELLGYCRKSADPVGRLVLHLIEEARPETFAYSDATCTALQLANFWQDVRRDFEEGRIYIPLDEMARHGYREEELAAGVVNDAFRSLLRFEVERTRGLFIEGIPLADLVPPRFGIDLELFSRGGLELLSEIERAGYDVLSRRPTVSKARKAALIFNAFWRRRVARG